MLYVATGRYPLSVAINYQIIKYCLKILNSPDTSYIKIVYVELIKAPEKHQMDQPCQAPVKLMWIW